MTARTETTALAHPLSRGWLRRGALALGGLVTALARHRSRAQLARLDDRLLRDIGLDAATAATETAKPFWRD